MDGCYPLVPALLLVLAAGSCGGHTGFYVDTATHTVLVAEATRRQQQQLAGELLALLGLPAAPRRLPATPAAVPSHMVALYRRHAARQHAAETEEDANLVISFPQKPAAGRHDVAAATLTFDVRRRLPPPPRGELRRLVLRMRRHPPAAAAAALTARLSVTLAAAARDMEQHSEPVIVTLDAALTGWVDFNLTDAITSSLSTQIHAVHIRLSITDASGVAVPFELSGLVLAGAGVDDAPALVAYVWTPPPAPAAAGGGSRRPRRAAAATASVSPRYTYQPQQHGEYGALLANSERQQPCQRRALHVNFADLKWQDWLIAPPHFSAFYCVGQCAFPLNAYMNASNHAIIQTLVHMFQVNIPKPGCAPTRLSPLSVLFIDEHSNVLLRDYQNMVVRACGCQ